MNGLLVVAAILISTALLVPLAFDIHDTLRKAGEPYRKSPTECVCPCSVIG